MNDLRTELERKPRRSRRQVQDQFRTLIRQARTVAGGLDRPTFNRRPSPGRWSVGECLEHLNASARLYLPVLTEAIEDGLARGLTTMRRDGRTILGRLAVWSQEPPPRFRRGTWPELEPEPDLDPADVVADFEALHEELIVRINESGGLDRKKIRVRSVLDRRLRLSLDDWFCFLAAHARRHLWQAADARAAVQPPGDVEPRA